MTPSNRQDYARRLLTLYTPLISDVLDDKGYPNQVLDPGLRPINSEVKLAGPAFTFKSKSFPKYRKITEDFGLKIIDDTLKLVKPGDVLICETGGETRVALWGELMTNASASRGVAGLVTDGAIRDVPKILEVRPPFPIWSRGFSPVDAKGRAEFAECDIPIRCSGVKVRPGDYVFADFDGIVIIPIEKVEEVLQTAEDKFRREKQFRRDVRNGMGFIEGNAKYEVG